MLAVNRDLPVIRAQESPFAPIAGGWWSHGVVLEIDDFGIADLQWRTYRWCTSEADTDCDRIINDVIFAGGRARIVFDALYEDRVEGRVLWVRGGEVLTPGPVTFWFLGDRLARFAQWGEWLGTLPLCREPIDPDWYREHNFPCGA
jgi:hypothetical protein